MKATRKTQQKLPDPDYHNFLDLAVNALGKALAPYSWASFFAWLDKPENKIKRQVQEVEKQLSSTEIWFAGKPNFRQNLTRYYKTMEAAIRVYKAGK